MKFNQLHQQENPLLIGNVWDAKSAQIFEASKFNALATSSVAIAHLLGYEDGEEMPFSELEFMVKRIMAKTILPLSVDLEGGYSRNPQKIADHIHRLFDLGIVGINLEDSIVENGRKLLPSQTFATTLSSLKNELTKRNISLFLNIRTDNFLMKKPNALNETIQRISVYEKAGADGIFVPCIVKETDISAVVQSTALPINVMCMPNLPDFKTLNSLGVKRISMGGFLFNSMYNQLGNDISEIMKSQSFKPIFG